MESFKTKLKARYLVVEADFKTAKKKFSLESSEDVVDDYLILASRTGRYLEMFQNLEKLGVVNDYSDDTLAVSMSRIIKWAKDTLKREDRVVWFLRIFKRTLLQTKSRRKTAQATDHLRHTLAHFISNGETNSYYDLLEFRFPPHMKQEDLVTTLRKLEAAGVEKRKDQSRLIEAEDDVETLVKFPDGWEWHKLPRGACGKEGASMRHCGNGYGKDGDEILSLREPIMKGKQKLWKPHATFILNKGMLGEMKGFANEKPEARLHPYIKALLLEDEIEGIKGGGYEAKKNFAISDLTDEDRAAIYEKKPEFDLATYYRNNKEKVLKECGAKGLRPDGSIIIDEWGNLAAFAKELSEELANDIKLLEDGEVITVDFRYLTDYDREGILELFAKKNSGAFKEFAKKVSADFDDPEALIDAIEKNNSKAMLSLIVEQLEDGNLDDLKSALNNAVASGYETGAYTVLYENIKEEMNGTNFESHGDVLNVVWNDNEHVLDDTTIYVTISEKDFLEAYVSGEMGSEDNDLSSYYLSVRNTFAYSRPNDINDYDEEAAWEAFNY